MTFAELERRAEAVGWKVLKWADGDLTVELNDEVDVTAHAGDHEQAAQLLSPQLEALLQAKQATWKPSGAPDSGPLRDAFLEVQRRKREAEVDGVAPPEVVATVRRKLADELPDLARDGARLDKLAEVTCCGMLWVAKMLAEYDLSFVEAWGVADSLGDAVKLAMQRTTHTPEQGVELGVGAGLYTGVWMGLLLAEAREHPEHGDSNEGSVDRR